MRRRVRGRRRTKRFRRVIGALFALALIAVPLPALYADEELPAHPAVVEQWRPLVEKYWSEAGYGDEVEYALMILFAESAGNPNAQHPGSKATGLFQHLPKYWEERSHAAGWGGASIWDPEANVAVAAWLRATNQRHGWQHWTPTHTWYPVGSYGPDTRWNPDRKRYVNLGGGLVGRGNVYGPKAPDTPDPLVTLTKVLQGDGEVYAGETLTWKYVVENPGERTLWSIYVHDDEVGDVWCPEDSLEAGESMKCWAEERAKKGDHEATARVYGWTGDGAEATAEDTNGYSASRGASISLGMYVDGHPADDEPVIIDPGDQVFYVITNTGAIELSDVYLWDADLEHVRCPLDVLTPGESMVCDAWPEFPEGGMHAWVTAVTDGGAEVKATDGISYRFEEPADG